MYGKKNPFLENLNAIESDALLTVNARKLRTAITPLTPLLTQMHKNAGLCKQYLVGIEMRHLYRLAHLQQTLQSPALAFVLAEAQTAYITANMPAEKAAQRHFRELTEREVREFPRKPKEHKLLLLEAEQPYSPAAAEEDKKVAETKLTAEQQQTLALCNQLKAAHEIFKQYHADKSAQKTRINPAYTQAKAQYAKNFLVPLELVTLCISAKGELDAHFEQRSGNAITQLSQQIAQRQTDKESISFLGKVKRMGSTSSHVIDAQEYQPETLIKVINTLRTAHGFEAFQPAAVNVASRTASPDSANSEPPPSPSSMGHNNHG